MCFVISLLCRNDHLVIDLASLSYKYYKLGIQIIESVN